MPAKFKDEASRFFGENAKRKPQPVLKLLKGYMPKEGGRPTIPKYVPAYKTESGRVCGGLNPEKFWQRLELVKGMPKGTILELHAGAGNLTETVYKGKAKKHILVEKDPDELDKALEKVSNGVMVEGYAMDNIKWIRDYMDPDELKDLVLVDFDPFGSPADVMKEFFSKYKVRKPLRVAVTDGGHVFLSRLSNTERGRKWLKEHYLVDTYPSTREKLAETMDKFMEKLGEKYGFKAKRVNYTHGPRVNYLGYILTPKS